MTIIGFTFTKMSIEKEGTIRGKISINNNVSIKDVVEVDLALGKAKQKALKFTFEFTSKYEPKVAEILLRGELLYLGDERKIKEITDKWKKDKKIPKDVTKVLLDHVLAKCNIQALILSKDINLPPPIPMPKVQIDTK